MPLKEPSIKTNIRQYSLDKRTRLNNTHFSIIDHSIQEITLWKINTIKRVFHIVLHIISFGLLAFLQYYWEGIFIALACECTSIETAQYACIKDTSNKIFVVELIEQSFNVYDKDVSMTHIDSLGRTVLEESPYIQLSSDTPLNHGEYVFYYKNNKYVFDRTSKSFKGVFFEISKWTNQEIKDIFKSKLEESIGIPSIGIYNYLYKKFGRNSIEYFSRSIYIILLRNLMSVLFLYNSIAVGFWFVFDYLIFAIIIFILTILIVILNTIKDYYNSKQLSQFNLEGSINNKTIRQFKGRNEVNTEGIYYVPGDILKLSENDLIPCDCLILDGYCMVDESDLIGQESQVNKKELPSDSTIFNYENSTHHFIYQGCLISQCSSSKGEAYIIALVLNTGLNTKRGNQLQNYDIRFKKNYSFYSDIMIFIVILIGIWLIVCLYFICIKITKPLDYFEVLFALFSPILLLSINIGSIVATFRLSKLDLSCFMDHKLNTVGKIDTIIFDKTGTLTENDLVIKGFYSTTYVNKKLLIDEEIFSTPSELNKICKMFWKELGNTTIEKYNESLDNNIIFFTECIACCHDITLVKDSNRNYKEIGEPIDVELFNMMKWELSSYLSGKIKKVFISPPNSFAMNDNTLVSPFTSQFSKKIKKSYKLEYLKHYPYNSNCQSMSVIMRNNFDNSIRVYTKGAAEKIKLFCNQQTIPSNFDKFYLSKASKGYRIIACATQIMNEDYNTLSQEELEKNMTFCGFIVFYNKIKTDTKQVISHLLKSNCKMIVSSGDNPYTTINVARECGLINKFESKIYLLDYDINNKRFLLNSVKVNKKCYKKHEDISKDTSITTKRDASKSNDELFTHQSPYNSKQKKHYKIEVLPISLKTFDYIKKLLKTLNSILTSETSKLCINGSVMKILKEQKKTFTPSSDKIEDKLYKTLLNVICQKGIIFSRMFPTLKADLIIMLKEYKPSIVCMCGDGENDAIALMTSDVGLYIPKNKERKVMTHFHSSRHSLEAVTTLLKCGRSSYENSTIVFKFLVLYGTTQMCNIISMNTMNIVYDKYQRLYIDIFCVLIPALLAGQTPHIDIVKNQRIPFSLFNARYLVSLTGHVLIQAGFQIIYTFFIKSAVVKGLNLAHEKKSYVDFYFMFSSFQFIQILFALNFQSIHRKPFYSNKWFSIYQSFILLFNISLFMFDEFKLAFFGMSLHEINMTTKITHFDRRIFNTRTTTFLFACGQFTMAFLYEFIVNYCFDHPLLCRKTKNNVPLIKQVNNK